MSLNTLNLKQKQGGRVIKQADRSSTLKFALQDSNGALINLNGQEADISLFNPNIKKYWSTKAKVKDSEVEFKLPGNVEEADYILEITVGGYVFPSDNDFIIEVVKGFKDLPDMKTGLRYNKTLEEISQEYIERSDKKLKENLDGITDERVKIDKANAEILKNINDTGSKYINDINTNYANVKLEFDKNAQKRKEEFTTIADNKLNTFTTTSDEALKNLKKTGDGYITDLVVNYNSAKTEFGKNASQKNEELKNNYDIYVTNLENKKDDVIAIIGNKKEEVIREIDGQVKISANKYLSEFNQNIDNKVDKVEGKELSDNNFTDTYKEKLDNIDNSINTKINDLEDRTNTKIQENTNKINDKVSKVAGKDLSDNNYTNQDLNKVKKLDNLPLDNYKNGALNADFIESGGNANTVIKEWVLIKGSNLPTADYWYLHTINYGVGIQKLQIAYPYFEGQTQTVYFRTQYQGKFSTWKKIGS